MMNQSMPVLESRKASEEELFYLKHARNEFGASLGRLEETAKFLIGAVGIVRPLLFPLRLPGAQPDTQRAVPEFAR